MVYLLSCSSNRSFVVCSCACVNKHKSRLCPCISRMNDLDLQKLFNYLICLNFWFLCVCRCWLALSSTSSSLSFTHSRLRYIVFLQFAHVCRSLSSSYAYHPLHSICVDRESRPRSGKIGMAWSNLTIFCRMKMSHATQGPVCHFLSIIIWSCRWYTAVIHSFIQLSIIHYTSS